jgi:hypothetical protein
MQRRRLLKLGAATGLVLAAAGAGLALIRPAWQGGQLTPAGQEMFRAVATAVLDGLLPQDTAQRETALNKHLRNLQVTLTGLPPALQAEVGQLATVLASPPGRRALANLAADWPEASDAQLKQALHGLPTLRTGRPSATRARNTFDCIPACPIFRPTRRDGACAPLSAPRGTAPIDVAHRHRPSAP